MNITSILKTTLITALMVGAVGCNGFLDEEPLDQRVESNFYQSQRDAEEALTAAYDVLQWNTVIGYQSFEMLSDIRSDDAYAGGGSSTDAPNVIEMDKFNVRTTNGEVHGLWKKYYTGIYRTNIYLEKIDGMDATEAFQTRTVAEAKFLRAYYYFDLVRLFGNVPLLTHTLKDQGEYSQPQADPADVYNQIAKDLMEAIPNLPTTIPDSEKGRVDKWAAEALMTRVYLYYNGVYGGDLQAGDVTVNQTKALELIEDVVQNSGHDLLPNYADNFKKAYEFSNESVFEIAYSDSRPWWDWGYIQGGEGNIAPQMQGPRLKDPGANDYERGWSFTPVSQDLVDQFDANDPRLDATVLFEDELDGGLTIGYQHTGYFTQKYTTAKEYKPTDGQLELNWGNNYRVIRFSDVLLMAAELNVKAGNQPVAQQELDRVRDRVGMPSVTANLDNIYHERRLELALEGQRYWDLLRRGMDTANAELTGNQMGDSYQGEPSDFNIEFDAATKGLFPIPQSEIDISNGQFNQNDGY